VAGYGEARRGKAWSLFLFLVFPMLENGRKMRDRFSKEGKEIMTKKTEISDATNGGKATIEAGIPYSVECTVQGVADLLFHRWNCDAIEAKSKATKGSQEKRSDDIESYIFRNDDGLLCVPGEYFRQAMVNAAKFLQDPRSPRKSAMDLFKSAVFSTSPLCSLGVKEWDYEDRRRVTVMRAGITRIRPALKTGWKCKATFQVNLPEYVSQELFLQTLNEAGRLIGVGDFRPTFGRFVVTNFNVIQ
jgi:hypothetical protein